MYRGWAFLVFSLVIPAGPIANVHRCVSTSFRACVLHKGNYMCQTRGCQFAYHHQTMGPKAPCSIVRGSSLFTFGGIALGHSPFTPHTSSVWAWILLFIPIRLQATCLLHGAVADGEGFKFNRVITGLDIWDYELDKNNDGSQFTASELHSTRVVWRLGQRCTVIEAF